MTRKTQSDVTFNIEVNFPVAGQDNDTQTFRDNFDTIYNGLMNANSELTDLLVNTAKKDENNDFNGTLIENVYTQRVYERKKVLIIDVSASDIDYDNGSYQILNVSSSATLQFVNFPTLESTDLDVLTGVGKLTLELSGGDPSNPRIINFLPPSGAVFKKNSTFPTSGVNPQLTLTSTSNPVIIEVWQHSSNYFFLNYVGQFS